MTDVNHESLESLMPGDIIELKDQIELVQFEDIIATSIDQQVPEIFPDITTKLNLVAWAGRRAIIELIRPQQPKPFNGTIANIQLEVMADAHDRLLDAKERGLQVGRGKKVSHAGVNKQLEPLYRGFKFFAEAISSGRGVVGEIQTELWYYPQYLLDGYKDGYYGQDVNKSGGSSVCRVVARPKIDADNFVELDETSRRIGLQVLRISLQNPISTPMRD